MPIYVAIKKELVPKPLDIITLPTCHDAKTDILVWFLSMTSWKYEQIDYCRIYKISLMTVITVD